MSYIGKIRHAELDKNLDTELVRHRTGYMYKRHRIRHTVRRNKWHRICHITYALDIELDAELDIEYKLEWYRMI